MNYISPKSRPTNFIVVLVVIGGIETYFIKLGPYTLVCD